MVKRPDHEDQIVFQPFLDWKPDRICEFHSLINKSIWIHCITRAQGSDRLTVLKAHLCFSACNVGFSVSVFDGGGHNDITE